MRSFYFPPPIWRLFFSFDPTYKTLMSEYVVKEMLRLRPCICGDGGPRPGRPSTTSGRFIDVHLHYVTNGLMLRIFRCRSCGVETTSGFRV